jgi:hypothetical protein
MIGNRISNQVYKNRLQVYTLSHEHTGTQVSPAGR